MDPITLLMAAQAAVSAIRKGCELLKEGRNEITKFKKTVEDGVDSAKAIYTEVTGLWAWLRTLFGRPTPKKQELTANSEIIKSKASKTVERRSDPELSFEEYQARTIHDLCEQLKTFYEAKRQLLHYCAELEETSKTSEDVEASAIDRVEVQLQLENMDTQIRETMVYAPAALKDIYTRFLSMYGQILEEQEFDRLLRKRRATEAAWQRDLARERRIDRAVVLVATAVVLLEVWAILLSLRWLGTTYDGL